MKLRHLCIGIAVVVLGAAFLLCAALLFLHAPWGSARLSAQIEARVSAAIAGELRLGGVEPEGLLHFRFDRVQFVDPEGRPAIAVDQVHLQVALRSLSERRLDVQSLVLQGLRVEAASGGIGEVFGPTPQAHPRARGEPGPVPPAPPLPIELRSLRIEDGAFRSAARPGGAPTSLVRSLLGWGTGWWDQGRTHLALGLEGDAASPLRRKLAIDLHADLASNWLKVEPLRIRLGDSRATVIGAAELRRDQVSLAAEGVIAPEEARAIDLPLAQAIPFQGSLGAAPGRLSVALRASTREGGTLLADGSSRRGAIASSLRFHGLDPSRWIVDAPSAALSGAASIGGTISPLHLRIGLSLDPGALAGEPFGPASLRGVVEKQGGASVVTVERSEVELPGAVLHLRGMASEQAVDLEVEAALGSLEKLRPLLEHLSGSPLDALSGEGELTLRAKGPSRAPALNLTANMRTLGFRDVRATDVYINTKSEGVVPVGRALGCVGSLQWRGYVAQRMLLRASRADDGSFALRIQPGPRAQCGCPPAAPAPPGGGNLDVDAAGLLRPGRLEVELRRASFSAPSLDLAGRGDAAIEGGRAKGTAALAAGGVGLIRGRFDLPTDLAGAPPSAPIDLEVIAAPIDLPALSPLLGIDLPVGSLRARLLIQGAIEAPDFEVDAQLSKFELPAQRGLPPIDARLHGALQRRSAAATLEVWNGPSLLAELEATAPLEVGRLRRDPRAELDRMLGSLRSRIAGKVMGLDLAVVGALLDLPELHGAGAVDFDLQGPLRDPRGKIQLALAGGPFGPLAELRADALAILDEERVRLIATASVPEPAPSEATPEAGPGAPMHLELAVHASPAEVLSRRLGPSTAIELDLDLGSLDLASITTGIGRPVVTRVERHPKGQGPPAGEEAGVSMGGPRANERLDREHMLKGSLSGKAQLRGPLAAVRGGAEVRLRSLAWGGIQLGDADVALTLGAQGLDAQLHAIDAAMGTLTASSRLGPAFSPLALLREGPRSLLHQQLLLDVDATSLSLAPLAAILGSNRTSGLLAISLHADGPVASLQPVGELELVDGSLEVPGGLLYDRIALHLRLEPERLDLLQLEAHSPARGSFTMSGGLGTKGARPFETLLALLSGEERGTPTPFDARLRSSSLPVGGPGGVAALISLTGGLEGELDPLRGVLSTIRLDSARVELPAKSPRKLQEVGRPEDIVIVSGPKAEGASGGSTGRRTPIFPLELHLLTTRPLEMVSPDVLLSATADLVIRRGRGGEAVADGRAQTTKGTATVLGRSFVIEHAILNWIDAPPGNPHLDITARYDGRQAMAWADVGGTAREPTITLRSDPPLPESQIVSLILSGRTQYPGLVPVENAPIASAGQQGQTGPGAAQGTSVPAASVIGSALTQKLGQALGPRIPVSVLTSESATGQTQVEAGTYVSRKLYLGYVRVFLPEPGENANEVRAEYELSRTVGIETRFGDAAAGGLDIVWQKAFETPAQQRARKEAARKQKEGSSP